jgi:hypothetical protein
MYFIPLYSLPNNAILFYSILIYYSLFYSIAIYSILFYSIAFYSNLPDHEGSDMNLHRSGMFGFHAVVKRFAYFHFAGKQLEPTKKTIHPYPVTNLSVEAQVYNRSRRLLQLAVSWIPPTGMLYH